MNPYLDEDMIALGDQVRRFAADRVAPGFQERDRTRVLDRGPMKAMGDMGYIAPGLPKAARVLCLQGLWLKDKGVPHSAEAGLCKWRAPKVAYDVFHQCLLMFGHGGYDRDPTEQRLHDVLGFQIGGGTAQIMKTIIARTGRAAVPV